LKQESKTKAFVAILHDTVSGILFLATSSAFCPFLAAEEDTEHFSPEGYRMAEFHASVPDSVPAGKTITTDQLQSLLKKQPVVLIDVMPTPIKPRDRPNNLLWLPPVRYNIPGSHWLPNVGYGALSDALENYFKINLLRLSSNDKSTKVVLYCLADCWMSWNAAKRAATQYGYTSIYWYPDGTTGWEAAGLFLEKSSPLPMENTD
jgi:PQQ-dependent catabolism-associated CXXCW motif protein